MSPVYAGIYAMIARNEEARRFFDSLPEEQKEELCRHEAEIRTPYALQKWAKKTRPREM